MSEGACDEGDENEDASNKEAEESPSTGDVANMFSGRGQVVKERHSREVTGVALVGKSGARDGLVDGILELCGSILEESVEWTEGLAPSKKMSVFIDHWERHRRTDRKSRQRLWRTPCCWLHNISTGHTHNTGADLGCRRREHPSRRG